MVKRAPQEGETENKYTYLIINSTNYDQNKILKKSHLLRDMFHTTNDDEEKKHCLYITCRVLPASWLSVGVLHSLS